MCIHIFTHMYVYIYIDKHLCIYMRICVCTHHVDLQKVRIEKVRDFSISMFKCISLCVYIYIYVYIHIQRDTLSETTEALRTVVTFVTLVISRTEFLV